MSKKQTLVAGAETVSLFCRLNINTKKDFPIRSSEMGLLILTVKNEHPVTPVMAADFFKVKKPMITAMAKKLIEHGYITKTPSKEDGRSFTLTPTEYGRTLAEQTYSEYYKTMELLRNRLGEHAYEKLIELLGAANMILLEEKENGESDGHRSAR